MLHPDAAKEYLKLYPDSPDSVVNVSLTGPHVYYDGDLYDFELNFPRVSVHQWLQQYKHLSLYISAIYIAATFTGERLMRNRQRFELRGLLFIWNVFMAILSGIMAYRLIPFQADRMLYQTLYGVVCDCRRVATPVVIWAELFAFSKVIEFTDTAFIILRKQHLAFLHWFHHATVLLVCWYGMGSRLGTGNGLTFTSMNVIVHTFMYTYYALRSIRVRIPRAISMTITVMQIVQMFIGFGFSLIAFNYFFFRSHDRPCDEDASHILLSTSIYFIYIFLFCRFFYNAYFAGKSVKVDKTE